MDIDEMTKLFLPVFAFITSVIAIVISIKNVKKQIRVGKLEEMLEILNIYRHNYNAAVLYTNELKNSETYIDGKFSNQQWTIINRNLDEYLSYIPENTLQSQTSRLYVLANLYLPNSDLKLKIISINQLYSDVFYTLYYKCLSRLKEKYEGRFPEINFFLQTINEIEKEVAKEMNLGFSTITFKEYESYFEKKFKKKF